MKKIQSGDQVKVMRGKFKGKVTKVEKVVRKIVNNIEQSFVYLEGLNIFKKSVKPNPALGIKGGFRDVSLPIHISNVMLYNADTNKVVKKRSLIAKAKKTKPEKKVKEEN